MRLLVGVDGSDRAMQGLEETAVRSRETGDTLTVAVYATEGQSLDAVENRARDSLDELGVDATVERIPEKPGGRLVERAEAGNHDRVVLAGGEKTPLGKIRLDSVAEFVLLNAQTTVTLIR